MTYDIEAKRLGISVRAYNCLRNEGLIKGDNVPDAADLKKLINATPEAMLLRRPNFGRKSMKDLRLWARK